jgi:hypothetical protein
MVSHTPYLLSRLLNVCLALDLASGPRHPTPGRRAATSADVSSSGPEQRGRSPTVDPWTKTHGNKSRPGGGGRGIIVVLDRAHHPRWGSRIHPSAAHSAPGRHDFLTSAPVSGPRLEITHESADGKGWTPLEPIEADQCRARTNPLLADRPPGRAVPTLISRKDRTTDRWSLGTLTDPAGGSDRPAFGPRW